MHPPYFFPDFFIHAFLNTLLKFLGPGHHQDARHLLLALSFQGVCIIDGFPFDTFETNHLLRLFLLHL